MTGYWPGSGALCSALLMTEQTLYICVGVKEMNVLLIGGPCQLMDTMVDVLNKNGHKSYLLMEGGKHTYAYRHAFEKYSFSYEDESVKDVMQSIGPDAVLFMGAQDPSFAWGEKKSRELSRYTASIANVISSYAAFSKGRFIYLSSEEIYGRPGDAGSLAEDAPPAPDGYRAMAVMQGEGICENCRRNQGKDMVILRLDHLYGMPQKGQKEGGLCFQKCLEAVKTGTVSASSKSGFSILHVKDAAAFIYAVISAESHAHGDYQLSSMEEISEMELARIISEEADFPVKAVERETDGVQRQMLDGSRFAGEFGLSAIADCRKEIREIIRFVKRNKSSYTDPEGADTGNKKRLSAMIKAAFPFVENVVCCVIFSLLSSQAAGGRYFEKLDFFLLYVLLFAIMHGQRQAILSALLAVLGYFFQQTVGRTGFEVLLDYNTYVWTAQLFIIGMSVGIMRDRMYHIREEQEEEIRFLKRRVKNIEEINDSNVRMKQGFETELVNQRESLGRIYELTSRLERYAPEEVLFYSAEMLEELMGSREVAVYLVANKGYARLFSATSPRARQLGGSYAYASSGEMYEVLKDHKVFINHDMDENLPMMASAVFVEDEMQFIFMVWGIPWQRMNLAEANRLMIAGALVQNSVVRSRRYLEALRAQRYLPGTGIMQPEAFGVVVKAFMDAQTRGLTECVLLEVQADRAELAKADQALGKCTRQTDYIGILDDGNLCVLLANTSEEKSGEIVRRIQKAGYETRLRKVR